MKRLVLVRHAQAVHRDYDNDFSRRLTGKGETDATKVSGYLISQGIIPNLIISSPALRAMQTAVIFAGTFSYPERDIWKEYDLYHGFNTAAILELLHNIPGRNNDVFIFGHNPAIENFAIGLCKSFHREVPTCSANVIDFPAESWAGVERNSGTLVMQVNPKELLL